MRARVVVAATSPVTLKTVTILSQIAPRQNNSPAISLEGTPNVDVMDRMTITAALGIAGAPTLNEKVIAKIISNVFKSISTPYILRNIITIRGM